MELLFSDLRNQNSQNVLLNWCVWKLPYNFIVIIYFALRAYFHKLIILKWKINNNSLYFFKFIWKYQLFNLYLYIISQSSLTIWSSLFYKYILWWSITHYFCRKLLFNIKMMFYLFSKPSLCNWCELPSSFLLISSHFSSFPQKRTYKLCVHIKLMFSLKMYYIILPIN